MAQLTACRGRRLRVQVHDWPPIISNMDTCIQVVEGLEASAR